MTTVSLEQHNIISEDEWAAIGRATEQSGDKAKERYVKALLEHQANPQPIRVKEVNAKPVASGAQAQTSFHKELEATVVPGVLTLNFKVDIEGGEDWSGRVVISYKVFGYTLGSSDNQISRTNSYIELHPGNLLAKADLQIGLWGEKLCFGIKGQACYRHWFSWSCRSFDTSALFCLKS